MKIIKPEITAGLWSVDGYGISDPRGSRIATVNDFGRRNPRGDTQAIAALPDVLAALEDVVMDALNHPSSALNGKAAHKAKQALEKAGYKFEE